MSFTHTKSKIEDGDLVFLYSGIKNVQSLQVQRGQISQVKFGAVRHDELIGRPFGSRYECAKGSVVVLSPSPELWSLSLPHRTQILYTTDISLICSMLYLKPGSKVVEAGTGSGSLSHAIARTIAPTGHLYTFDFHEERAKLANQEFRDHALCEVITCQQRDVCQDGFGLSNLADAVFLDLPKPWLAVPFAYQALKTCGTSRICCFSPCIEQVQRSTAALQQNRFIDVETFEVLLRPYEFKYITLKAPGVAKFETADESSRTGSDAIGEVDAESESLDANGSSDAATKSSECGDSTDASKGKGVASHKQYLSAIPLNDIAGHTGFLTFATKL